MVQCPNIALIGGPGAGKDTLANFLVDDFGYQRFAFADPLRALAEEIDPDYAQAVRDFGYETAKRELPWVRETLVRVGEMVKRTVSPDVWINALIDNPDFEQAYNQSQPMVVTDVRFENEADMVSWFEFELAVVNRPHVPVPSLVDELWPDGDSVDISTLPPVVFNYGSLDFLRSEAGALVRKLSA